MSADTTDRPDQPAQLATDPDLDPDPGIGWAYAGFIAGLGVSIAANMLHALTPDVRPEQLIGAAVWPIFLLIAVEVLSRVDWGTRTTARIAGITGAAAVAAVAAIASYQHMRGLLLSWGESPWLAAIEPLAVDGLMVLCGMAILASGTRTESVVNRVTESLVSHEPDSPHDSPEPPDSPDDSPERDSPADQPNHPMTHPNLSIVRPTDSPRDSDITAQVLDLANQGTSQREIARILKTNQSRVGRIIRAESRSAGIAR